MQQAPHQRGLKFEKLVDRLIKYLKYNRVCVSFRSGNENQQSYCMQKICTSFLFPNGMPNRFVGCITNGQQ